MTSPARKPRGAADAGAGAGHPPAAGPVAAGAGRGAAGERGARGRVGPPDPPGGDGVAADGVGLVPLAAGARRGSSSRDRVEKPRTLRRRVGAPDRLVHGLRAAPSGLNSSESHPFCSAHQASNRAALSTRRDTRADVRIEAQRLCHDQEDSDVSWAARVRAPGKLRRLLLRRWPEERALVRLAPGAGIRRPLAQRGAPTT